VTLPEPIVQPRTSLVKMHAILDFFEAQLMDSSQTGVTPLQIGMAMVLPFLRQQLDELALRPGELERILDGLVITYARLRSDDADGLIILGSNVARIIPHDAIVAAGDVTSVEVGSALSIPGLPDWL
jgi:hypothetical protein